MRVALAVCACAVLTYLSSQTAWAHDSGFGLARYSSNGALDRSFGNAGVVVVRSRQRSFIANALALQSDGRIVIAGMSSDLSAANLQLAVARFNTDGSPDATFGIAGSVATPVGEGGAEANAIALQADGMILVAGTAFAHGATTDRFLVARYTSTGMLDGTFGTGGVAITPVGAAGASASALAVQRDGAVIVVGTAFSNGATDDDFAVARYSSTGQLDTGFGSGGLVTTDFGGAGNSASLDRGGAVGVQADGKLIAAGFTRGERQSFAAARYSSSGMLDPTFGWGGKVQVSAAEPQVFAVMLPRDGDVVLAGSSVVGSGATPFTLVRLHSDGAPDERFGEGGVATATIGGSKSGARAVVVQPDGKLVAGGASFGAPSAQGAAQAESGFALARYNADGSSDATFGASGLALTPMGDAGATPLALALQPDGKILAAGLVFFQVPSPEALTEPAIPPAAMLVAGSALASAALGFALKRWRGTKRGLS